MSERGQRILVTRPDLPPLERFVPYLERIWSSRILTNGGPMHREFETALAAYLGVEHVAVFNNATTALMIALRALDVSGEVITTPYSFVATVHSIAWNGIVPVFVDIDPATFNLDPGQIEGAITTRTRAIMPVHCYGNPCDVGRIEEVARRNGLKVIYDAAHAFAVKLGGMSLLAHGDLSVLSFHATKVFNTCEGGAIVCRDVAIRERIDRLKNFGIVDADRIDEVGLNGKMNELQAALGLLQLESVDSAIARRRRVDAQYRAALAGVPGIELLPVQPKVESNAAYFPILVGPQFGEARDALCERLHRHDILVRRYFYPLLSDLPMYRHLPSASAGRLPHARRAAQQVLCLPIHASLGEAEVDQVIDALLDRGRSS